MKSCSQRHRAWEHDELYKQHDLNKQTNFEQPKTNTNKQHKQTNGVCVILLVWRFLEQQLQTKTTTVLATSEKTQFVWEKKRYSEMSEEMRTDLAWTLFRIWKQLQFTKTKFEQNNQIQPCREGGMEWSSLRFAFLFSSLWSSWWIVLTE